MFLWDKQDPVQGNPRFHFPQAKALPQCLTYSHAANPECVTIGHCPGASTHTGLPEFASKACHASPVVGP